jgi:hypothetical protein
LRKVEINSYVVYKKDKPLSQNAEDFLTLLWERQKKARRPSVHERASDVLLRAAGNLKSHPSPLSNAITPHRLQTAPTVKTPV